MGRIVAVVAISTQVEARRKEICPALFNEKTRFEYPCSSYRDCPPSMAVKITISFKEEIVSFDQYDT